MEQIKIDIVPVGVAPVAHASQFDNGRQIRFNLFNQGAPYTLTGAETVTMVVNGEEENITNTSDNYVIWDVAEEDCAEVGVIGCEIRIVLGSMLIGSKNFFLEVEMDPYDGKNIRIVTVGPADICTFETTLPEPLQSVLVNVLATGGNGTPDNPIPIVGYSEANITANGNTYTIAFGQTVYGGVLDVTRGKLHVTWGKKVYDGSNDESWSGYNSNYDGFSIRDDEMNVNSLNPSTQLKGNIAKTNTIRGNTTSLSGVILKTYGSVDDSTFFFICGTGATSTADLRTFLASNLLEVAYELATPFDIDLTPVQIRALVGENNVFADCGQTEVKYLAEG